MLRIRLLLRRNPLIMMATNVFAFGAFTLGVFTLDPVQMYPTKESCHDDMPHRVNGHL
jgi:hypothetical protein